MQIRVRWFGSSGIAGYAAALVAVGLVSAGIGVITSQAQVSNVSMLYLIVVLAAAAAFGSGPAILASLAAFLTYDWFFVEPLHSLSIGHINSWISLFIFLLTAIITGQLAAGQRTRARQAEQREREAVVLSDIIRLMSSSDFEPSLETVAERLRRELHLPAVRIEVTGRNGAATRVVAGDAAAFPQEPGTVPGGILSTAASPGEDRSGGSGTWVRVVSPHLSGRWGLGRRLQLRTVPVRARGELIGALQLACGPNERDFGAAENRLLSVVAVQLGLVVEHLRLRREATDVEVLRRTDALKSSLLNAVSHDLRTPLVSIMAAAGSLMQQEVQWSMEERQQFAESIEKEAQRLNRLVGNLLDFSRIEAGSLKPREEWHDLGSLISDVLDRLRPLTAHHRLLVDIPEELPPVELDYVQIDEVLSNLIENATKYSPEGTRIEVVVRQGEGELLVVVSNHGPEIPEAALPHLFEPFYQVDGGVRSGSGGTGLGLAVARGLVDAHGGRLWASSGPDETSFTFSLPMAEPARIVASGSEGGAD